MAYLIRRMMAATLVIWLVLTATFFAMRASPGQPAALYASPATPPSEQVALVHALGLDQPLGRQYVTWLGASLTGNWGTSLNRGLPVTSLLAHHLPATLLLGATSIALAVALGLPLGLFTAIHAGSSADRLLRYVSLILYSLPTFWLGLMAILTFSYIVPLFPPGHFRSIGSRDSSNFLRGFDVLHHLVLPSIVLGVSIAPSIARLVRRSLLETLSRNFIICARARGLSRRSIVLTHALPLAVAPVAQVLGLTLPLVAGGVLITEVVFSWPGMGRLTYTAVMTRDYPVVLGATALTTAAVTVGSLLADLIHAAADPRVRPQRQQ